MAGTNPNGNPMARPRPVQEGARNPLHEIIMEIGELIGELDARVTDIEAFLFRAFGEEENDGGSPDPNESEGDNPPASA